jgi:hypothetical protein
MHNDMARLEEWTVTADWELRVDGPSVIVEGQEVK